MQGSSKQIHLNKALLIQSKIENILNFYDFDPKQIGRGAFGVVYKARQKQTNNYRAIKKITKQNIKNPQMLMNQVEVMKTLDHPNILKIYQTFEDKNNLYIVLDICQGGELFDRLQQHGSFSQSDARILFRQILDSVSHCHQEQIAHRDLKPENFLFLTKDSFNIKLIDFGLAFKWKTNMEKQLQISKQKKVIGTSYYIAPQVLTGFYDQRCDIWSAGVILYILVSGTPPFDGQNDKQILSKVKKMQFTMDIPEMELVSKSCKNLIQRMIQDVKYRISLDEIYKHQWMITNQLSKQPLKLSFKKMKNYSKSSKLRKITATFLTTQLSEKYFEQLGVIFRQIDLNHDGYISVQELRTSLVAQNQNIPIQYLKYIIQQTDTDKNGKINYYQFLASTMNKSQLTSLENLKTVFKMLDIDNNGVVDKKQLLEGLISTYFIIQENGWNDINGKDVEQIVNCCDVNGDGKIDFNQYVSWMKSQAQQIE